MSAFIEVTAGNGKERCATSTTCSLASSRARTGPLEVWFDYRAGKPGQMVGFSTPAAVNVPKPAPLGISVPKLMSSIKVPSNVEPAKPVLLGNVASVRSATRPIPADRNGAEHPLTKLVVNVQCVVLALADQPFHQQSSSTDGWQDGFLLMSPRIERYTRQRAHSCCSHKNRVH
jgi:hypothetical protein